MLWFFNRYYDVVISLICRYLGGSRFISKGSGIVCYISRFGIRIF